MHDHLEIRPTELSETYKCVDMYRSRLLAFCWLTWDSEEVSCRDFPGWLFKGLASAQTFIYFLHKLMYIYSEVSTTVYKGAYSLIGLQPMLP